jgi:peroxiredoxin
MSKAGKSLATHLRTWIIYCSIGIVVSGVIFAVAFTSREKVQPLTFPTPVKLKVGQKAPEFTAATTAGPFDLAKKAGKPVLLEIFATWCPHCQLETKVLNVMYDAYKDKVAFVAVSGNALGMDGTNPSSQEDIMQFAERFKVRYPVAYDPDLTVANKYMQNGYPTIVIIGKDGNITAVNSGETTEAMLEKALDVALKGGS